MPPVLLQSLAQALTQWKVLTGWGQRAGEESKTGLNVIDEQVSNQRPSRCPVGRTAFLLPGGFDLLNAQMLREVHGT